ncbi:hypothetical protein EDEG_01266 [Edhazardia aedis USNM 41457]|uniref:Transmembrane protein n=1 Tax=Edhazardia aedis (strain USNM 41457) TaxID=1003232 RepID=J9DPN2_EDHAE|nr:hypothetical protein EDEG_01266 [Edhazardia aedis USNM 41457]|eukprot:EJW04515.1 hypothetical protein EDEG_01266 [Edhazardia aedis USNM 41457]
MIVTVGAEHQAKRRLICYYWCMFGVNTLPSITTYFKCFTEMQSIKKKENGNAQSIHKQFAKIYFNNRNQYWKQTPFLIIPFLLIYFLVNIIKYLFKNISRKVFQLCKILKYNVFGQ